jgi:transposase, IS5 family
MDNARMELTLRAPMIRRRNLQVALAEVVLTTALGKPEDLMDPILRFIDTLLDDEELVDRVHQMLRRRRAQSARRGRYGTPAEVVLRLQVLKHLKGWSFEQLEWEVKGNVAYRHFCRIHAGKVPDSTTMVRHGQLLHGALRPIFDRIVQQAREQRATSGRKMRIDTTVVEAPIRYPTDSGLCEDGVRVLRRTMSRLVEAGVKLSFKLRHVGRSVSRRMREIGQALRLRGEAAKEAIKKPYRRLLRITARLVRQAEATIEQAAAQKAKLSKAARIRIERGLGILCQMAPRIRRVVQQTRARIVRGVTNSKTKLISLFEPHAQILRRGKLHRPTEFGQMVKVQEAEGGIVTDIGVVPEKNDTPLLVPAVERHIEVFGRAPQVAATDRGFYSGEGERRIRELGVKHPVIPKPGHKSKQRVAHERQRWFRRGRAWRAGGEARISRLKHRFGMVRSRYKGENATMRTALWAGIANNLVAIAFKMDRACR